ncbi:MAG: multicopper oxidase domain-containing protein [Chloroflexi bacterium]|nr:multicopper oxidase domain-containing protein [Chloroflexota bacterium]
MLYFLSLLAISLAGLVHLAIAPGHYAHEPAHGIFFALAGALEIGWAIAFWWNPSRSLSIKGIVLAGGLVLLWAATWLTLAVPLPLLDSPEPISFSLLVIKASELVGAVALGILALRRQVAWPRVRAQLLVTAAAEVAIVVPMMLPLFPAGPLSLPGLGVAARAPAAGDPHAGHGATIDDSSAAWADWLKNQGIDEATYGSDPNNPTAPKVGGTMPYSGGPILGPMPLLPPSFATSPLPAVVPDKVFNISAIDVVIMVNRFGDNDPEGKMYVLDEDIPAVRAREAMPLTNPNRVDIGLRDDPIQPLVIRANVGEVVQVNFTNRLAVGRASMDIHGLDVNIKTSGGSFVGLNPDTTVGQGETITYTWAVPDRRELEGSYVFNSMGDPREQQMHGLFGVLNVEPRGSTYINPNTGGPSKSGWEAIIVDPNGKDFREDTIMYHEFGDETFDMRDKNGNKMPTNDFLGVYRPGSRALNYRSEPFFRRQELAEAVLGFHDESQSYGSYMFGDPATPFPRGYIGDPTKRRIVHPGSERFHSEHLHGGSIRWPFNPFADPDFWGLPFNKHPKAQSLSQRLDVQAVGPGETYTELIESGAGGLQAGAGEFLFHCHFPNHYIGGMWAYWRVFDTLQTAQTTLAGEPPLAELPDRAGQTPAAVNSIALMGRTLPSGRTLTDGPTTATTKNIDEWMRSVLPPQGDPGPLADYDASVWDWVRQDTPQGPLFLGEPEDVRTWVNYTSPTPGQRPEILFNPNNGRPTFPLMRPHLGKRPPFAPGRSGSPWLGQPDADHPDSLIPADARRIQYTVVAVPTPITFNERFNITSPLGALQMLDEDKADILAGRKPKEQLTIRANVGDGVDVTYYSEETDAAFFGFAKTNIHIHFVQFDTQASDGVISGMSYDQSVRPYKTEGPPDGPGGTRDGILLAQPAAMGANQITVDSAATLKVNAFLGIGFGVATNQPNGFEFAQITAKNGNTLTLDRQLQKDHPAGQFAGVEFVRYQWYADAESGTTFFHDHVFGVPGFGKALTGVLIQEPRGSRWLDPVTGNPVRSGTNVVIETDQQIAPGYPIQNFREFVLHNMGAITDLAGQGESRDQPGGFNMRQEPIGRRLGANPDPSLVFSSVAHGDPATPLLRAYAGDMVMFRVIQSSGHDSTGFHLSGHRFLTERFDPREMPKDSLTMVIAERYDLPTLAGEETGQAGDYVYMDSMHEKMMDGAWGIFRVHDTLQPDLLPIRLPGPPAGPGFPINTQTGGRPPVANDTGAVVPQGAPVRTFDVVAVQVPIQFSADTSINPGRAYVLAEDEAAVLAGDKPLEPLVIRANVGEAVRVNFANHLPGARASFHIGQTTQTADSLGAAFGFNNDSTVAPGGAITQWFYIDPEHEKPRSLAITDFGDPENGGPSGLYGAFIVEPAGSTFHDPKTGLTVKSGAIVDVRNPDLPGGGWRDVALVFHDSDQKLGRDVMPYVKLPEGISGINYKAVPFAERLREDAAISRVLHTGGGHDDPRTPLIEAITGDPMRVHVIGGTGNHAHTPSFDGHRYPVGTAQRGEMYLNSRLVGAMTTVDMALDGGAGGTGGVTTPGCACPGDYLYGDRRVPFMEAGMWGVMRVSEPSQATVLPLRNLVPGWNLVSAAVRPADTAVAQFLASIAGKFDAVAVPDPARPGQWLMYRPAAAQNTLTDLDESMGFWVHMTQGAFLSPAGTAPAATDVPLTRGWNLVGWPSSNSMPVDQALASIAGKFDLVYAYDALDTADPWKRYDVAAPAFANDLTHVQPLLGFWVHMTADGTLTVQN